MISRAQDVFGIDGTIDDVAGDRVAFSDYLPTWNAGSGEELAVCPRPVSPAWGSDIAWIETRRAPVLTEAQHKRVVQQASLFQI